MPLSEEEKREKARVRHRRWRLANPEKAKASVDRFYERNPTAQIDAHLRKKYGITLMDRDIALELQGYACAICLAMSPGRKTRGGKDGDWIVDHNHKTGKVRGIVCHRCNMMLGMARDNVQVLQWAIDYLEANS